MTGKEKRLPLSSCSPLPSARVCHVPGATVLVPLLTGLNPLTALFTSATGTIIFHLITGGVPLPGIVLRLHHPHNGGGHGRPPRRHSGYGSGLCCSNWRLHHRRPCAVLAALLVKGIGLKAIQRFISRWWSVL